MATRGSAEKLRAREDCRPETCPNPGRDLEPRRLSGVTAHLCAKIHGASFKPDRHLVEDIEVNLWKQITGFIQIRRLRRRQRRDESPRSTVRLCRLLEERGRSAEAIVTARIGLDRFPHAHELADVLRRGFARAGAESSEQRDVVRTYLDHALFDEAARAARDLIRKFPNDPKARLLHGQACLALFGRDHASKTGAEALESLRRASELDPDSIAARRSLAEAQHAIGATSQALFHIRLALEADPHDEAANRLYTQLQGLPFQRRAEKTLLWEAEINDQPVAPLELLNRALQLVIERDRARLAQTRKAARRRTAGTSRLQSVLLDARKRGRSGHGAAIVDAIRRAWPPGGHEFNKLGRNPNLSCLTFSQQRVGFPSPRTVITGHNVELAGELRGLTSF